MKFSDWMVGIVVLLIVMTIASIVFFAAGFMFGTGVLSSSGVWGSMMLVQ